MKERQKGADGWPLAALTPTQPMTSDCIGDIRAIIANARKSIVSHVNSTMVLAYWLIGRRLVVEEQKGRSRAGYGEHLLERISHELTEEFGNGFAEPQLRNCRLFYKAFPTEDQIRYTLCIKLSWSHLRLVMRVPDPKAREFYMKEASANGWSVRDLDREIRTFAYDRVISNHAMEEMPREAMQMSPERLLKDPCVAEFLDLKENLRGKEKKAESRICRHIEEFMLELGKGFALVGRQYRIPNETTNRYIDLVFYNILLRCYVLVDLKTSKLTPRDIGQMDTYRRMFDALKKRDGDAPTIGILLCTEIDESDVKYSVMSECERMFATKFMPYMPKRDELLFEIERSRGRTKTRRRTMKSKQISSEQTDAANPHESVNR